MSALAIRVHARTHTKQVDELRALLAPRYGAALEIGSVDGFQGREKEAVGAGVSRVLFLQTPFYRLPRLLALLQHALPWRFVLFAFCVFFQRVFG